MKYIEDINMKENPNTQKQQAYSFWQTIMILYSYRRTLKQERIELTKRYKVTIILPFNLSNACIGYTVFDRIPFFYISL